MKIEFFGRFIYLYLDNGDVRIYDTAYKSWSCNEARNHPVYELIKLLY